MCPRFSLLAGVLLVLLAAGASAQRASRVFGRYGRPLESVTLDLDTGTLTRGPQIGDRRKASAACSEIGESTVADFDNLDLGGFTGIDTGNGFCRWIDAAVKGTGAGRTAGVNNHSDLMDSIVFAYCSSKLTPGSGGPGGSVALHFYEGYTLFGGAPTTHVAGFTLRGLPANSASSSFFGGSSCYFMTVVFAQLVSFADGPIGYSWTFLDSGTGMNPLGAVLAGTWPFLACVASCSGRAGQVDGQGMTDAFDKYCPPSMLRTVFTFGTTSGSYSSIALAIREATDREATFRSAAGIPPAPDVLSASPAVLGASWTATVTSGLARAKGASWSLFFGNTGVALPTGFDVGQFPKGGGNFGTSQAGRRLLCDIDARNPSSCANVPLGAGIGAASACSATIPKRIGLVCNAWCAQALVVGAVPAGASGGGNARLTNSIGGVLGTHP